MTFLRYLDVINNVIVTTINNSPLCLLAKYHMKVELNDERIFSLVGAKLKLNKSHVGVNNRIQPSWKKRFIDEMPKLVCYK